ncbi:MAG: hypothetical protein K9J27_04480 [Bacteroidales bacterium]|nr:hypothetical protein [Bacteroidales bacterium]MCF8333179.1 hypothetical protein [Bacteroidales bacterium]
MLEKVERLNLKTIDGNIKTYYAPGYKESAESTSNLLHKSMQFYEEHFDVWQSFALAVIDSGRWIKITQIPYGLPFVSGPPNIVCLPANSNNTLSEIILTAMEGHELHTQNEMTHEEIVNLFISLIGFHELGHIYADAYGINFPNKWIFEFAATYFAYFYLEQNFPGHSKIWMDVSEILAEELAPSHTSLNDFEEMYVRVGIKNYAWYQAVFMARVKEVYQQQGKEFLEKLKKHQWTSGSSSGYLNEMENISSGFTDWAQKYRLQEND